MDFISRLLAKPHLFRRITTFSKEEFDQLAEKLEPEWHEREQERLMAREGRKNAVGQGRHYTLGEFPNLLLATVLYLRTTIGRELLGLLLGVDAGTVKRAVERVSPLLTDRFMPETAFSKRKKRTNTLDELLRDYPELTGVIFDGFELPVRRPKKRQRRLYSGKKKRHTKKSTVALDKSTKLIVGVAPPVAGCVHDKRYLEQLGWDRKLPEKVRRYGDLGYQGMPSDTWKIPQKKPRGQPLTRWEKRENRALARERIPVEHGIRGIKIFRRVGEVITAKTDELLYTTLLAAANLANYKRLVRQGLG